MKKPTYQPTKWVSSLFTTQKLSGNVQVCIDPQRLNQALKRRHNHLPIIKDISPHLSKAKLFTKANLKDGFLHMKINEESSKLTTLQTPWGRYRWLHVPYRNSPSPECFQQQLNQCLEGHVSMYNITDDLLIIGQGDTAEKADLNHDDNLKS